MMKSADVKRRDKKRSWRGRNEIQKGLESKIKYLETKPRKILRGG